MRTTAQLISPVIAGAAVVAIAAALTGCASITDRMHHQHEERFDSYESARVDWSGPSIPSWIPQDATTIRSFATDDWSNAIVRVDSASELPSTCTQDARSGMPFEERDWGMNVRPHASVERCGDWEVLPTDDGWFAWFHAARKGDLPAG